MTQLRLTFPSRPEYLVLGRLVLSGLARIRPIDVESLGDLKLALTEASSNAIRHGYGQTGGTVEILYDLGPAQLTVEVSDDGPGFDATASARKSDALDEGGLGLAIIHAVSDVTEMGRKPDGSGSWIRFAKRLDEEEQ